MDQIQFSQLLLLLEEVEVEEIVKELILKDQVYLVDQVEVVEEKVVRLLLEQAELVIHLL